MTTDTPAPKKKAPRKTVAAAEPASKPEVVATAEPAAPAKKRTRKTAASKTVSPEERHHLIEVAAYYLAERRGFGCGSNHDDWVQAEQEIDQMIAAGKFVA